MRSITALAVVAAILVAPMTARAQSPAPSPSPRPAGDLLTVKVTRADGDVSYRRGMGEWTEVTVGQELASSDELHTGPESQATLAFSDGSVLVLKELSQLMIGTLLTKKDKFKIELLLKLGEVKAQVQHRETVRSDFSIRTPTATASVRGTEIERVSYYPPTGMQTQLLSGQLLVDGPHGSVMTNPGDGAQVNPDGTLETPGDLTQDRSRIHAEPIGLTQPEIEQIQLTNQPQATNPSSSASQQTQASGAGTLIFRVVLQ